MHLQHIENEIDSHFETKVHNKIEQDVKMQKKPKQTIGMEVY
jgi:hypothetical protein